VWPLYCLHWEGSSMERRKMDLPDCSHGSDQPAARTIEICALLMTAGRQLDLQHKLCAPLSHRTRAGWAGPSW
jgi:hypothetical protein